MTISNVVRLVKVILLPSNKADIYFSLIVANYAGINPSVE